jgi:hypothetical protein
MSWIERTFYAIVDTNDPEEPTLYLNGLSSAANTQLTTVIRDAIRQAYQDRVTEMQTNLLLQPYRYIVPFRYKPNQTSGGSAPVIPNRPITLDGRPYTLRIVDAPPLDMTGPTTTLLPPDLSSRLSALRGLPPQTPSLTRPPVESVFGPMTGRDLRSVFSFSGRNARPSILRAPALQRVGVPTPFSRSSSPYPPVARRLFVEGESDDDMSDSKQADDGDMSDSKEEDDDDTLPPLSDPTHVLRDGFIQDGEYSGKVTDMLMASDETVKDYLKEDPDNVIIIVDLGSTKRAVGYPRSQLRAQYQDKSAIRYECHVSGAAIFEIRPTDVDFERPYYRLSVPEPYLIPVVMMIPLFESTHRIWRLSRGTNAPLPFTASRSVIASRMTDSKGNMLNLDGQVINLSSASHCGPGTDAPVMDLHAVRLPASVTGGRRRRTVRRNHKKHKNVPPTRRRKVRPTRK